MQLTGMDMNMHGPNFLKMLLNSGGWKTCIKKLMNHQEKFYMLNLN